MRQASTVDAAEMRATLRRLTGGLTPTHFTVADRQAIETGSPAWRAERLTLAGSEFGLVRAILTGPPGSSSQLPAALYCHAHGGRYEIGASELLYGRPMLQSEPYGQALAAFGICALCIDMPCFGERREMSESALSKRLHWEGRTLFGLMLAELEGAFALLANWPGVAPHRVGTLGFSMGATHSFWLAALEPRVAGAIHACAMADMAELIAAGGHDLHGAYMTVPGLLREASTGAIAGLVAPRPQLALMGALDPLTPLAAAAKALGDLREAYAAVGADESLEIVVEAETGHSETPAMRARILEFLARL